MLRTVLPIAINVFRLKDAPRSSNIFTARVSPEHERSHAGLDGDLPIFRMVYELASESGLVYMLANHDSAPVSSAAKNSKCLSELVGKLR
jgi:hypothetical protein